MSKAHKHHEEGPEAPQAAQDMPVVKPRSGGRIGRNTLEDQVETGKPSLLAPKSARSTFRDLRPV